MLLTRAPGEEEVLGSHSEVGGWREILKALAGKIQIKLEILVLNRERNADLSRSLKWYYVIYLERI